MSEQWTTVAAGGQRRAAAGASSAAKSGSRMTYVSPPARNGDRSAASAQQAAAAAAPKMRYVPPPTRNGVKPTAWEQPAAAAPAAAPKMRYVPPPARNGDHSKSPPPPAGAAAAGARGGGSGKMKYVPPPKNAGEWVRPKKSSGGDRGQWDELARKEDERLKASKKKDRAEAKQRNAVGMSGNDKADMLATQMEFDIWTKKDAVRTLAWARAEECRIPNKRVAKGGRLHKLINILLNNCDFVNEKLVQEKRYQDACRDPTLPSGLELKRQFVGPLAKKVLNKVVEEEAEAAFKADDPDSDDSEGMAM